MWNKPAAGLLLAVLLLCAAAPGRAEEPFVSNKRPREVTPEYLKAVQLGLDQVVNSDTGTGRLARIPGVRVVGKTGTAEAGKENTHAWFVGYAPARDPKIALVVFLEHGGHGGVEAATIAHAVLQKMKDMGYL